MAWSREKWRAYHREWNRTRRDKAHQSAYYEEWYRQHKATRIIDQRHARAWLKANPLARYAHGKVRRALESGKLVKSKSCQSCGVTNKRLIAHHADYSAPLDVVWLCDKCHRRGHVCAQILNTGASRVFVFSSLTR